MGAARTMSERRVIFNHGHESGPDGAKIRALRPIAENAGFATEAIDYTDLRDAPVARRDRLIARLDELDRPAVLVGSSLGGWVAMAAAEARDVAGLWLMAPALFLEDRVDGGAVPDRYRPRTGHVEIVHGWHDDIIAWRNSARFAESCAAALHIVADGHRLENSLDELQHLFGRFLRRIAKGAQ